MADAGMLAEFVRESNAIEGIYDTTGRLWSDHLWMAQAVAEHPLMYVARPRMIHRHLMLSQPRIFPGEYRRPRPRQGYIGDVMVGGDRKMPWQDVPLAMKELVERARSYPRRKGFWNVEELWPLHYEFEVIHPFFDGNGRTGRLWLNAIRQACGFEWVIVREEERWEYYDRIRAYEQAWSAATPDKEG